MILLGPQEPTLEGIYTMNSLILKYQFPIGAFKYRFVYNSDKIKITDDSVISRFLPLDEIMADVTWVMGAKYIEFELDLNSDLFIYKYIRIRCY